MEASETGRRIFWRHRWLLLVLMILPAAGVVALRERQPVTFAATAVVQGQGTTPDSTTQVSAIQSRVAAVATDPALVQAAINRAKISRNAVQVVKHDITVSARSSSAIMAITVTDKSASAALALSGTLATAVVDQLNQLGVKGNPELVSLSKIHAQLVARRDQLQGQLSNIGPVDASTSVEVQSLLSQLAAADQELANNDAEQQQVLATLTTETGASVVSLPAAATGASRHAAVDGALAALLGLVAGLLFATLREVLRPSVAQPGAGARELGAVLFGSAEERGGQVGSPGRLSSLATRLRSEMPSPEAAGGTALGTVGHGDDASHNGDVRRPAIVSGEHRTVGLAATDWPVSVTAAQAAADSQRTVVTLNDIRLGAPPPDAALVVVLPRFAPHSALDQAADLGVTADWPILGVIGLRHRGWLASLIDRDATRNRGSEVPNTVTRGGSPDGIHEGGR